MSGDSLIAAGIIILFVRCYTRALGGKLVEAWPDYDVYQAWEEAHDNIESRESRP